MQIFYNFNNNFISWHIPSFCLYSCSSNHHLFPPNTALHTGQVLVSAPSSHLTTQCLWNRWPHSSLENSVVLLSWQMGHFIWKFVSTSILQVVKSKLWIIIFSEMLYSTKLINSSNWRMEVSMVHTILTRLTIFSYRRDFCTMVTKLHGRGSCLV